MVIDEPVALVQDAFTTAHLLRSSTSLAIAHHMTTTALARGLIDLTIQLLRSHAPFNRMDPAHLEIMASSLSVAYFPADAVILAPEHGEPTYLHIIKQGTVLTGRADEDAGSGLALHQGECFPLGAMLAHRPVSRPYLSSSDTFCYLLPATIFQQLLEQSAPFQSFCTQRIAHLLQEALASLNAHSALSADRQRPLVSSLGTLLRGSAVTCPESTSVREALDTMRQKGIGSMVVTDADANPIGIFTLHDLMNRVALAGRSVDEAIGDLMTRNPVVMPKEAFAFEAALMLSRHGVRHILVMDGSRLAGVISEKDLFALQRVGLAQINAALNEATEPAALAKVARDIREFSRNLLAQGVDARHLSEIISSLNDLLSRRVFDLELHAAGLDAARLCWISLGSEGRHEQTLASDQDNAIVFLDTAGDPDVMRKALHPVAQRINHTLDACGFALCRGGIMASNPRWCLSETEWRQTFRHWINEGDPHAVLNATIFFDFRPLSGEPALAEELRAWLTQEVVDNRRFLRLMAQNALQNRPPLGVVRDFTLTADSAHPGTIDLKVNGATLYIDAARVCALASGGKQTNTARRLEQWATVRHIAAAHVDAWVGGFHFLQLVRLRHQQQQVARGEAPDNFINPAQLNDLDRRILKESMRQARNLQSRLALDFQL